MIERKSERFNFENFNRDDVYIGEVIVEIDLEKTLKVKPVDISLKGIGFIVSNLDPALIDEIEKSDLFYLKLYVGTDFLIIGVKKIWNLIKRINDEDVMQVGVEIDTISQDDNLKLSVFINKIRSSAI